jgi:DNA-binding LytR/AlgR family response regulator
MINLNIAFVDDDVASRKRIAQEVKDMFLELECKVEAYPYGSGEEFYSAADTHQFDLILLDIEMPGIDGILLAKKLHKDGRKTRIVYVSNREDLVFESLETRPYGFVRKSHFQDDMRKIVRFFVQELTQDDDNYLLIQSEGSKVNLPIEDILYIESNKRYQQIHVKNLIKPYVTSTTFQTLSDLLVNKGFIICYRGIMINFLAIKVINEDCIELKNGKTLPMSRRHATETKEQYMKLVKKQMALFY